MTQRRLLCSKGFTLVELMVAITISLIILAAVTSLFVSTKRTYTEQDRQAKMQENARFALNFLAYDLRQAGYYGCLDDINTETVTSLLNASATLNALYPIEGVDNATGQWYPSGNTALPAGIKANTDAIVLRMADPNNAVNITDPMPNTSAELKVDSITNLAIGDIVMLSDCSSADVFQLTNIQTSSNHLQHNSGTGTPGNSTQQLSKRYSPPSQVLKFITRAYFIKDNPVTLVPGLFRQENGGAAEELVAGVDQMQITYGKDTNTPPDDYPNIYLKAGAAGLQSADDWGRVRTIRIGLLVRTPGEQNGAKGGDKDAQTDTKDINGESISLASYNDNNRRRIFHMTVKMRNL